MNASLSQIGPLLVPLVLGVLLLSCAGQERPANESESPKRPTESPKGEFQFEGVVQYRQIEGGAWVIESEEGTTYEPSDLPEEYREEGLRVRVWANRLDDQVSFRMVGPIISIERIERRE